MWLCLAIDVVVIVVFGLRLFVVGFAHQDMSEISFPGWGVVIVILVYGASSHRRSVHVRVIFLKLSTAHARTSSSS